MKKYIIIFITLIVSLLCFFTYVFTMKTSRTLFNTINTENSIDNVVVQSMMSDMVIMIGTQMGGSLANQQLGNQAAELTSMLTKQSKTIQANMKSFQAQAQAQQQKELQTNIADFIQKENGIQTKTNAIIATSNQELDYLYQNISLDKPQQEYLNNPIVYDQIFSQGTMLTPLGAIWKNPFSVGDWEYEKDDNSFYQYQKSPIFIQDSHGNQSSVRAENNSIFTEYNTVASKYTIAGTITFYQIDYPFFVGIIFNKARWISGNSESLRKSRMIGMYGKSATDIGVYYAEQHSAIDTQVQEKLTNTPLQQILNDAVPKRFAIPLDTFKDIKIEPVSFNFEIINSLKNVTFSLWSNNVIKQSITIDNADEKLFIYHGIGFICPGAIAQFKLTEPKDLIFSDQAILKYKD